MWVQGTTAHYTLQLGTPNLDTAWEDTYGLAMPPHLFALSDQGGGGLVDCAALAEPNMLHVVHGTGRVWVCSQGPQDSLAAQAGC
jgi:hypothetical protein